jgi:hypothetical protein
MTVTQRLDKHDKQIASIRELIHEGMRLVVETRKDMRKLAAMQLTTETAQRRTEASLRAFIESLRGGGNGHTKRRVD